MKILIALYDINDLGGIINHTETLYGAFKELGHTVDIRLMVWKERIMESASRRSRVQDVTNTGMSYDQQHGWFFPAEKRFAYKGKENLAKWHDFASGFDLIVWEVPVPSMSRDHKGDTDWLELYGTTAKSIVTIHDGNMVDSYPWIYAVYHNLWGGVGAHPCGYHSLKHLPIRRALSLNPHANIAQRIANTEEFKDEDRNGWFSVQTFKGWKHVDDIVRAVPFMGNYYRKVLGGGGIQRFYMTSPDKLKLEYMWRRYDDERKAAWVGRSIWNVAVEHGMEYIDFCTNLQRDTYLMRAKCLIDPSWSLKYASIGDHFNRTPIEALIAGAIPILRDKGLATDQFFKPDANCFTIPYDATPKQFGELVDQYVNTSEPIRQAMLAVAREHLLPLFEAKRVAQTYIDMAEDKPAGIYQIGKDHGDVDPAMNTMGQAAVTEFFGAKWK